MSVETAITVTGTAQQQAWRDRVLPDVELVRPGLWSVPTVFPDSPLRYVLSYLVETSAGLALIDTGWPREEAWTGLVEGIQRTGHDVSEVAAVLVTHHHSDHFGLASRVREASGARIAMHRLDVEASRRFSSMSEYARTDRAFLRQRGVPQHELDDMVPLIDDGGPVGPHAQVDVLLEDGDRPMGAGTRLRAIWTPGHTPGHVCFAHEEYDVLLTGDHILPRISPNISPSPLSTADTLGEYLDSLGAMASLEVSEVLPAHEYRFHGLPARVRQLQEHHAHRLAEIVGAIGSGDGLTTLEVAEALTWSRPWSESRGIVRRSAIGETYAHLVHLERLGRVDPGRGSVDAWRLTG